jgi:hypothetical protein
MLHAIHILAIYIKQRFNPLRFAFLACCIIVFPQPEIWITWGRGSGAISGAFMITALFLFRLFDDLMHHHLDVGKPHRIYTRQDGRRPLQAWGLGVFFVFLSVLAAWSLPHFFMMSAIMAVHLLLYVAVFHLDKVRPFLPLIKYPLLAYWACTLHGEWDITTQMLALSVLLGVVMMAYEMAHDATFPLRGFKLLTLGIYLLLPIILKTVGLWAIGISLVAYLATIWWVKRWPAALIVCIFTTRMILFFL